MVNLKTSYVTTALKNHTITNISHELIPCMKGYISFNECCPVYSSKQEYENNQIFHFSEHMSS